MRPPDHHSLQSRGMSAAVSAGGRTPLGRISANVNAGGNGGGVNGFRGGGMKGIGNGRTVYGRK